MTVLPYFPGLQEDELLYGAVARYHREAAWSGWSATLEVLFGRRHVAASYDLPGHVGALAERLRPGHVPTLDALADGATLLAYLTAATDPDRREAARRAVVSGGGASHLSLGLASSPVPRLRRLRFCPECRDEAVRQEGVQWWRRRHQLPGSLICVHHRNPLLESVVDLAGLRRHEFLAADRRSCPSVAVRPFPGDTVAAPLLLAIATAEAEVLDTGLLPRQGRDVREGLASAGLFRSGGRVDQRALMERIVRHYAPAARWLPCALSAPALASWVPTLTRGARGARHPLFHVVLSVFLDAQEPRRDAASLPFGSGPWPCLNPLPVHEVAPARVALSTRTSRGRLHGRFSCSCGYVYSRGLSNADTTTPPRYVAFGPTLEPELRRLVDAGVSLRAVARALGIDPSTVILEARRAGVKVPWDNARRRARRRRGRARRTPQARRGEWSRGDARRDWAALDVETLARFTRARSVLLAATPPSRVTVSALERQAKVRVGWLRPRRPRLPLTTAMVDRAVESTAAFKARRATFAISTAEAAPVAWRIMRAAGLTGADLPMIEALIAAGVPIVALSGSA